jgi:hypothetical protein
MAKSTARKFEGHSPSAVRNREGRRRAGCDGTADGSRTEFRLGEIVDVYFFGGPNAPQYRGRARILSAYDAKQRLYVVRFNGETESRVEVVVRSLQGDPAAVLADLKAHWAARVSMALFGPLRLPAAGSRDLDAQPDRKS